jgi:hypothetical protein
VINPSFVTVPGVATALLVSGNTLFTIHRPESRRLILQLLNSGNS